MATILYVCFSFYIGFLVNYVESQKCSITASSFEDEFCAMKQKVEAVQQFSSRIFKTFEDEFCAMKQKVEAVQQFSSRISTAEHELLTLKHTIQTETAELKDNQNSLHSLQKNMSDTISRGTGSGSADMNKKIDKLLTMFKDVHDRLDHLEVKCQVCGSNGTAGHPCDRHPCKNGGKCLELSKDFQCVCKTGFTGERCEYTDHCASSPCKNGGNCSSNILGHVCHCASGYTGPFCEVTLNACDSNPCKHGRCILDGTAHKCICDSGYDGSSCEHPTGSHTAATTKMTTPLPVTTSTYPDPCLKSASICNEPAKCKAVGPKDFICVCPETDKTKTDKCLTPYYYEKFGFCCMKNSCKNDAVEC